jgi:hypothetical protein
MARNENPPFGRGECFFDTAATVSTDDIAHTVYLEGMEWVFEDLDYSQTGAKTKRTGHSVRCKLVRNTSGAALLPKRLVTFEADGLDFGQRVDGYSDTTAEGPVAVVDEWLPAAGVQANNLFWVVVEGPTRCLTDIAASASNVITAGMRLVSLTAATSGATTAGRVAPQSLAGATAPLGDQIQNSFGYALSAKTTNNTNADVLVLTRTF